VLGGLVLNLRTGDTRKRTREDLWSHELGVAFQRQEDGYPEARRFVSDLMCVNQELVEYIQTLIGYCFTGRSSERKFYSCIGGGMNGKSALFMLLLKMLGPCIL